MKGNEWYGGRWGPPWRQDERAGGGGGSPYQDILAALGDGGLLWVHDYGTDAAVEGAVSSWVDVTDTVTLVRPGAASKSPTRKSNGVDFDGIDDVLWIATLPAAFDAFKTANGATGGTAGFGSVEVGTGTGAGDRALTWFQPVGSWSSHVVGNFQLQQSVFPAYFSSAAGLTGLVSYVLGTTNATCSRWADATEDVQASARWGTGYQAQERLVVGADQNATGSFWDGRLGAIWLAPRRLSSAEIATLYAALTAAGY